MYLEITIRELMDAGLWVDYCEATDTNSWAVNEGRANLDDDVALDSDLCQKLGVKITT